MNTLLNNIKTAVLPMVVAGALLASCNKGVDQFAIPTTTKSGITLDSTLRANPNDSMYYRLVRIASNGTVNFVNLYNSTTSNNEYTLLVPDNAAMMASGFSSAVISATPVATAAGIVSYNTIPQRYDTAGIGAGFPNFTVGTSIFPSPTAPFVTFRSYLSKRPGILRANTIPMTTPLNVKAFNGNIHHVAAIVAPPVTTTLWDRINADATPVTGLTYLRAAILRADSGAVTPGPLQAALLNGGANLTVFAPTDAAFQALLTGAITQALIAQGFPPATAAATAATLAASPNVFQNPALFGALSARTVRGILVTHLFSNTAFTVNFPSVATNYPTLLNTDPAFAMHPGIRLQATFAGPFVSAATVRGAANASASNILINPTAATGTSDQFYVNGVIHKIDQVLLPQ
ncbi:hypothetical protein ACFOWM_02150 [Ferruginibacter yonginensis]|uniref:FAS1 domain-containing protein n=1 Tax=Ferruginibacter yonginensis TaxID=1310416 RepID=A0ABV8QPP0_9BACT